MCAYSAPGSTASAVIAWDITGVYAGRVELTGPERVVAWLGLLAAAAVFVVSLDLLTGGRLLGWSPMPAVSVTEVADDDG